MANALNTSKAPPELALAQFFTPALRAWLVNELLPDSLAPEMPYALLELGYSELPPDLHQAPAVRDFLKREMSQLAARQTPEAATRLLQLCEQIVQLYLLLHPAEAPALRQLNQRLPPGVSFSLVSGRLLFEPALYFQPHNLSHQEQTLLAALPLPDAAADVAAAAAPPAEPPTAAAAHAKMPESPEGQRSLPPPQTGGQAEPAAAPAAEASAEPLPRHQHLRQIRARRLQLLKEWES
jgi:hypothetical protein